ncbi:MAG: bifunctional diaminohydroxyphosphoribosylaminopyrimidine deaminase/5-amino-6-(5-phosphoribosylamino)uracil reductase RibD [Opitutaceae bacterium]|nr:bifunctional diaminohydroxyphosphoribosylaminopyrimidine deaminase/5-amino-6-(5-phosphoribosylamino)uracil reductase RibD [Cytophagales bacterium]
MKRALELSRLGLGRVSPNPMVGAVIVHEGRIIGEGWHKQFGGPHAEVNAINDVVDTHLLSNSTMYVTLEPCCHFGKTPPCADLIIAKKIKKVVIAMLDPNPLVAGKGLIRLNNAGIVTTTGIFEKEATKLNRRFITNILNKRPYIILKWAQTTDGFLAPGLNADKKAKQISNSLSQQLVHAWRAQEDAILVGYNTLIHDNPKLNVRLINTHRQPTRITWDEKGVPPSHHHFFDGSQRSFIFNHIKEEKVSTHSYLQIEPNETGITNLLNRILKEGIGSVIIEGGTKTLDKFINLNLWDEARICTSTKLLGSGIKAPNISISPSGSFHLEEDCWKIVFNSPIKT